MASPKVAINLDRSQINDLLFAVGRADDLARVVETSAGLATETSLNSIGRKIATATDIPAADVNRLCRVVLSFLSTRESGRLTTSELADAVSANLPSSSPGASQRAAQAAAWAEGKSRFCQIIDGVSSDHPFQVLRKVVSVVYAHQNVLNSTRIVTELRPVFDDTGEKILHTVVSHKLLVHYYDGARGRRIEFGLDAADLAELVRCAQRGLLKAAALEKAVSAAGIPVSLKIDT